MGSPLTSAEFVRLLDERLKEVSEAAYMDLPSMIPMLAKEISDDSAWMEFFEIGDVPDIPEFNGKLSYLSIAPGFHTKIEHKEYAAGLMFERKLIDDKKYPVLESRTSGLMKSAQRKREKAFVRNFAYAFSSAFDFMEREEGVALCSSSHTTKSGASTASGFDNAGTSALSKTSVAATRILMRQFRNDIGERIDRGENFALIVPDNLADLAMEINGTKSGYDTAADTINTQYKRYEVIPYLRLDDYDTNNWFMTDMDMQKEELMFADRIKPELNNIPDFETFALKSSVYLRFATGFKGWRWIYGHQVS